MRKIDKIIQYHIDNNLTAMSKKFTGQLNDEEVSEVKNAIALNLKLKKLRVAPAFGKHSFEEAISQLDIEKPAVKRKFSFSYFSAAAVSMSALLLVFMIGGMSLTKNSSPSSKDSIASVSDIAADGSVDSISNLSLADLKIEQAQLKNDNSADESTKIDFANTSNMDEAINENF
jgi:hypothetical protein